MYDRPTLFSHLQYVILTNGWSGTCTYTLFLSASSVEKYFWCPRSGKYKLHWTTCTYTNTRSIGESNTSSWATHTNWISKVYDKSSRCVGAQRSLMTNTLHCCTKRPAGGAIRMAFTQHHAAAFARSMMLAFGQFSFNCNSLVKAAVVEARTNAYTHKTECVCVRGGCGTEDFLCFHSTIYT